MRLLYLLLFSSKYASLQVECCISSFLFYSNLSSLRQVSTPCYFTHLRSVIIDHGCEKSGCHVVQMSELCTVVFSVCNLLHVILTATTILRLLLFLWKICGLLSQTSPVRWGVESYAVISLLMLLSPSQFKVSSPAPCSQILSVYLCPQYRAREESFCFCLTKMSVVRMNVCGALVE
jgi:hypothetical protein